MTVERLNGAAAIDYEAREAVAKIEERQRGHEELCNERARGDEQFRREVRDTIGDWKEIHAETKVDLLNAMRDMEERLKSLQILMKSDGDAALAREREAIERNSKDIGILYARFWWLAMTLAIGSLGTTGTLLLRYGLR